MALDTFNILFSASLETLTFNTFTVDRCRNYKLYLYVCEKATKYRRYGLQTTCDNDGDCPRPSAIPTDLNFL